MPAIITCSAAPGSSSLDRRQRRTDSTGRSAESAEFVEKMLTLLPNTPFEKTAQQWKADSARAATTNLICKNCHSPGRLSAKLAALNAK